MPAFPTGHPWTRAMFRLVSNLVIRHPRAVLLAWLGLIAGLHCLAPPWNRITKDDVLGLFPADSPSMIARQLLERGFPQDASSSDLVMIYRREDGRLTSGDFHFVEAEAASVSRFAQQQPDLGVKKIDTYRSPVIGPRLIGSRAPWRRPARCCRSSRSIAVIFPGRRNARSTVSWSTSTQKTHEPPPGLVRAVTGSAAVGRDTHAATDESIKATTNATIALVILILLIIYRSALLAIVPLVTIAFSVFASLRLIALLAGLPGLGLRGDRHHADLRRRRGVRRRDRLLSLPGAPVSGGAGAREIAGRGDSAKRSAEVGPALVASAATVIVGLGMLGFSRFATFRYTGPTIALSLAVALVAALTLAPAMLVWLGAGALLAVPRPHHEDGGDRETESREAPLRRASGPGRGSLWSPIP